MRRRGRPPGQGNVGDQLGTPPLERFFQYVMVGKGCWEWQGARGRQGYGRFAVEGTTGRQVAMAHRVAYEAAYGLITPGLQVAHTCDNPPCVRPSHLFLATALENITDAVRKGRMNYGARNAWETATDIMRSRRPPVPLTTATVADIRRRFDAGESQGSIARSLDITTSAVSRIVRGLRHARAAA